MWFIFWKLQFAALRGFMSAGVEWKRMENSQAKGIELKGKKAVRDCRETFRKERKWQGNKTKGE